MTKCQTLKEISELSLPKNDLEIKKYKYPNFSYPTVRTVKTLLTFIVKIYRGLTLKTFRGEQLAE